MYFWKIEGKFFGVDVNSQSGIINTYTNFIWEPIIVRQNALAAATEVKLKITNLYKVHKGCMHNFMY